MMTFFQEKEVEKLLLEKKLSGKLLYEIKDHMISQILEIQYNESLPFDEAFEKSKLHWEQDLMMVRKNLFSRQKITKISFEVDKIQNKNLFLRSLLYAFLFVLILITLAFVLNEDWYLKVNKVFKIVFTILPLLIIGMYIQQKRLTYKNQRNNIVLNNFIHPLMVFAISIIFDNLVEYPKNSYHVIYEYINSSSHNEATTYIFVKSLLLGTFLLTLYLFSYLSLSENIKKLKNYTKNYI